MSSQTIVHNEAIRLQCIPVNTKEMRNHRRLEFNSINFNLRLSTVTIKLCSAITCNRIHKFLSVLYRIVYPPNFDYLHLKIIIGITLSVDASGEVQVVQLKVC